MLVAACLSGGPLSADAAGQIGTHQTGTHQTGAHPTLIVATPPGTLNQTLTATVWRPFARLTHSRIRTVFWDGDLDAVGADLHTPRKRWALLLAEDDTAQLGCVRKLFVPMPGKGDSSPTSCGVPALSLDFAMTWDSTRFPSTPNWGDFWDVARHPGKRGLRADPRGTLEIALLADGVPPDAVYQTLSTPQGVDRAFRRLSQIRPYIVWWKTPDEAIRILSGGAALMGVAPTNEVAAINIRQSASRFRILWSPLLRINYDWVLPASDSYDQSAARALQNWATSPEQLNSLNAQLLSNPQTSGINAIPPEQSPPSALPLSAIFWRQSFPALQERFDRWMAQQ